MVGLFVVVCNLSHVASVLRIIRLNCAMSLANIWSCKCIKISLPYSFFFSSPFLSIYHIDKEAAQMIMIDSLCKRVEQNFHLKAFTSVEEFSTSKLEKREIVCKKYSTHAGTHAQLPSTHTIIGGEKIYEGERDRVWKKWRFFFFVICC